MAINSEADLSLLPLTTNTTTFKRANPLSYYESKAQAITLAPTFHNIEEEIKDDQY